MSLFAGTGFFTQSAVLFPTSIEKNKKTEACSRDPQASSSWERKAPAALFHRGEVGEANPGEGVGGGSGAPHRKITPEPAPAMQIHREQSARTGARPQGGLGLDAWAALPRGADPKGTPNTGACPSLPAVLLAAAVPGAAPLPSTPHPPSGKGLCFDPQVKGCAPCH